MSHIRKLSKSFKNSREILKYNRKFALLVRKPMLKRLSQFIAVAQEHFDYWNKLIKEKKGIDLELKVMSTAKIDDTEWLISVSINRSSGEKVTCFFSIKWRKNLCPLHFNLEVKKPIIGIGEKSYVYVGVTERDARSIAKELIILANDRIIPGVLFSSKKPIRN